MTKAELSAEVERLRRELAACRKDAEPSGVARGQDPAWSETLHGTPAGEASAFLQSTLNALSAHIAVLDQAGTILAVNDAWSRFARANGASPEAVGVGANYLSVCDRAGGPSSEGALEAADGVRAVIAGEREQFSLEYPCHYLDKRWWFVLRVSRLGDPPARAVVAHEDITERKLSEDALRESEHRFRTLFRNNPVATSITTLPEGRFVEVNARFVEITGFRRDELIGRTGRELGMVGDLEVHERLTHRVDREQGFQNMVAQIRLKSGEIRTIMMSTEKINVGEQACTLAQFVDVTEREEMEKTLRETVRQFNAAFDSAPLPACITTFPEGRYLEVNRRFETLTGYSRDELLGQRPEDMKLAITPERVAPAIESLETQGGFWDEPLTFRTKSGEDRTGLLSAQMIQRDGQACVLAEVVDVTELREVERALRESEERWRLLVENHPDPVLVWADGVIVYANPSVARIALDIPDAERLIGQPVEKVVSAKLLSTLRQPEMYRQPTEYTFVGTDGRRRFVEAVSIPVTYRGKRAIQTVARDITERRQAEEELRNHLKQQAVVAELGLLALEGMKYEALCDEAVRRVAETLRVEYVGVLELLPSGDRLRFVSVAGWPAAFAGSATIGAGPDTQAGYTLRTEQPVILDRTGEDAQFHGSPLLREHGVVSGLTVIIGKKAAPFGVFGVHTRTLRPFKPEDVVFLQAVANVLAEAVQRQRAEQAVRQSEQRYRLLFEKAPISLWETDFSEAISYAQALRQTEVEDIVGYFEQHPQVLLERFSKAPVIDVNEATLALYQASSKEHLLENLREVMTEEGFAGYLDAFTAITAGATAVEREVTARTMGGRTIHVVVRWVAASGDGEMPGRVLVAVTDVTAYRRMEESLKQYTERLEAFRATDRAILSARSSEETADTAVAHLRQLIPSDHIGVSLLDAGREQLTLFSSWTSYETKVTRGLTIPITPEVLDDLGHDGQDYVPDARQLAEASEQYPLLQRLAEEGIHSWMRIPLVAQGAVLGILSVGSRQPSAFMPDHLGVALEIAESFSAALHSARLLEETTTAHTQLQGLTRRLVSVQEEERRHLALELHDEVGAVLTLLSLNLDIAGASEPGAPDKLREAKDLSAELIRRIQDLSFTLRPSILDHLGLLATLVWYVQHIGAQTGVPIRFQHVGLAGRRFAFEVETAAFRIVQEALTNIIRHAETNEATVRVWTDMVGLHILVADKGKGFDRESAQWKSSTGGLSGMRERAASLGGRVLIESTPGSGTQVVSWFPLADAGSAQDDGR